MFKVSEKLFAQNMMFKISTVILKTKETRTIQIMFFNDLNLSKNKNVLDNSCLYSKSQILINRSVLFCLCVSVLYSDHRYKISYFYCKIILNNNIYKTIT